jgi:hypothetical protein
MGRRCIDSALAGGEWSASRHGRITLGETTPGTYCIGSWVVPTASLDDMERRKFLTLPGLELLPLCPPAHSQSLYRLRHPGSQNVIKVITIMRNLINRIWGVQMNLNYSYYIFPFFLFRFLHV